MYGRQEKERVFSAKIKLALVFLGANIVAGVDSFEATQVMAPPYILVNGYEAPSGTTLKAVTLPWAVADGVWRSTQGHANLALGGHRVYCNPNSYAEPVLQSLDKSFGEVGGGLARAGYYYAGILGAAIGGAASGVVSGVQELASDGRASNLNACANALKF